MVLKAVLDDFAAATGLAINYHTSTFVPLHIRSDEASLIAETLGCPISSFPQPYLGLPLSASKLYNSDFQPLIAKCDKYLSGWHGKLLSTGGRLVLTNAVLSSLPVYWMSSLLLPKGVIDAIDRRRRAFLWTGEESCSGSRCLIAWDRVCMAKLEGGLGVKDLATQNHCLLLKFVHKLLSNVSLPWRDWLLGDT